MEEKEDGIDKLSNLPDHILISILSLLSIKAAFRSSILSNRWRPLWKSVPVLDFHRNPGETWPSFRERVVNVLFLRNDDCNLRRISFGFGEDASEQPIDDEELFEQVMKYAASHGLQQLSLFRGSGHHISEESFYNQIVGLVSYCNHTLETLEMMLFHLTDAAVSRFWPGFKVLTTLTLSFCSFHPSDSQNSIDPFAKFPCLKNLKLVCCSSRPISLVSLKISGLQLLKLELVGIAFFLLVEVTAPKLESFGCWGDIMLQQVPKLNIPCLDRAYVRAARYDNTALLPLGKEYMEWFRALYNTKCLTIHFDVIKILSETHDLLEESKLSPFTRLMLLNVLYSEEEEPVIPHPVMRYFMEGSPDVKMDQKRVKFHKVAPPAFPDN
ncbi:unnamed protein product [Linum trigynum]|uniref:F-box domain-containing protein n=1 Tax=Linum trigynum TaxID=586398 RepID=A0AAV2GNQ6_9ROSI